MLDRNAAVRFAELDRRHDPDLIVRPADGFDAGRFAQFRIPAIRRNAKRRTDRTLIAKPNFRSTLGKHQAIGLGRRNPDH